MPSNTRLRGSQNDSTTILVVGLRWPPETFIAALLKGLMREGIEIIVASPSRPSNDWMQQDGFRWLSIPPWAGSRPLRLLRLAVSLAKAVLRAPREAKVSITAVGSVAIAERLRLWNRMLPLAGRRYDVVYFPWNSAAIAYLPLFELGRPVIISCRGSQVTIAPHDPRRAAFQDGLRETFARAKAVHCVSESIEREARLYGLDEDKVHLIRPAVDVQSFRPAGPRKRHVSDLRVVSVGSLIWRKGYEYSLRAISILKRQGIPISLDIIGEGADRQRLLYTILDLDLAENVTLHGNRAHQEVRAVLDRADIFLLSSLTEGISNAALEAMACGLPIVTTDCGGMREVITDGVEGFVVPLRSATGMATAISNLWRDPELRRRMGEAARARVVSSLTLDSQVGSFANLCRSLKG